MGNFEFGIRVPNSGPLSSKENIVKAAQSSEELGFDTVWLHDHVVWSSEMHRHHISSGATEAITDAQEANFFECMTTMSYLAAKTKDIQIGVACLVMPLRNPIYAAKQCATLDHLCDGRLLVGVGLGSKATRESSEFDVFEVPIKGRGNRTDEYIEAMKAVWTQPMASYEGKYLKFDNAEIHPKPVQKPHPPVWVGGWMDQAAVRAGRYGEGWIPGWLSPKEMARGCEILRNRRPRTRAGIPRASRSRWRSWPAIARTRDEAMTLALPTIRESSHTYERDVDNIQFALDRHIIGSVDDIRRRIDEFIEAGVQHFELKLIYPDMDTMYKEMLLWSEEIIPHYV